jgi:type I restriction enzyme S subunit
LLPDRTVEHFSIGSQWLRKSGSVRLDASFYNPRVAHAIETLNRSGLELTTLGEVCERIFIPGRFARTYVEQEFGIPFLQGSHIVHFQPADIKFVSPTVHKHIEKWVIHKDWILVTRSGTVGRVAITPEAWDGWAASEHILRIVPKQDGKCPPGYLFAYLSSPIGQAQLTAQIYGAVVDELTEDQARSVIVPLPKTQQQFDELQAIADLAMLSTAKRNEATLLAVECSAKMQAFLPMREPSEGADTPVQRAAAVKRVRAR